MDNEFDNLTKQWFQESCRQRYSYQFSWMGRPVIQYPQDLIAMQELIWEVQPDLIVETGIAHGGSLVFYASMLELIGKPAMVVGVDVDIRQHNRIAIEGHPMKKRLTMIEGSSTDPETVHRVWDSARDKHRVLVVLDSNHTHDHVLEELRLYSPMVTRGSYMVVMDTMVEDMPGGFYPDRPWGPGNNPKTAVYQFLKETKRFVIDPSIPKKLKITAAPDGYLKCVADR